MTRTRTALVALTCLAFALVGTNLSSGPASAADDVVDQSQTASTDCYYTVDDFYSFAQTFTAGRSGPLTRVDLLIDRFAGTPAINVGIYATDDSGIPTGPALATGTLPTLPDSVQGFQSASFSTPPVLVKDTKYAIEASAPGDNTNSGWCFNTNQPYTGGEGFGYATQAPDPAWTPYDVDFAFRTYIGLPAQTITLGDLPALKVGGDDGDLTASASSGLPVTFSSQTPATCTVVGDTHVHPVATGTCTIAADQAGDDTNYASAPQVSKSAEVSASDKLSQTITFANPGPQHYGAPMQLSATATSGLPVTFSIGPKSNAGCVVSSSGYLTFNDFGSDCVIVASQVGNDEYAAADPVTQTFDVGGQDVYITVSNANQVYGSTTPPTITTSIVAPDGYMTSRLDPIICKTTTDASSPVGTYLGAATCKTETPYLTVIHLIPGDVTVTPAPVVVTAGNTSSVWGTTPPTPTPSYDGFKNGQTSSVLTVAPVCSTGVTASSAAGNYLLSNSCTGAMADNYMFSYVRGAATVAKANLSIAASPTSVLRSFLAGKITFTAKVTRAATSGPVAGVPVTFSATSIFGIKVTCVGLSNAAGVATCASKNLLFLFLRTPSTYSAKAPASTNYNAGTGSGRITAF